MANVYKSHEQTECAVVRVNHNDLEIFPPREVMTLDLPPSSVESIACEEEVEAAFDPEALREAVLREAREEAEIKLQEAYAEGHRRGLESAEEEFAASVGQCAQALAEASESMKEAQEAFLDTLSPQVFELATLVAEGVLGREVRSDPELVHSTARRALQRITDRQRLLVRVNPDDLEALRRQQVTLLEEFDGIQEMVIEADEAVQPGGCMVESELMQVDARLETLLANILGVLTE